jgi:polysaccharide export outer membrane protein
VGVRRRSFVKNKIKMFKFKYFLFFIFFIYGCGSTSKYLYFNNLEKSNFNDTTSQLQPLIIQSGDVLQITVTTIDKDISALLNPISGATANNPIQQGYVVDTDGYIELPFAGKIFVKGKTTAQINQVVKDELSKTIKNVFVSTRLVNFRISVLGDVANPGSFSIQNERLSLLDALSLAGDLNISAVRDDVMIIRETNGKKKYISINMNDKSTLSSPYFYLANNDVVYVKPGPTRVFGNTRGFQIFPYVTSVVSLLVVVVATILANK